MSNQVSIRCADDFLMGCYRAEPTGPVGGAIVVIQEIFGVNTHIREVADGYAEKGYIAYAPKLFDRIGTDIELGYSESDMAKGIDLAFSQLALDQVISDVQETVNHIAAEGAQKIGIVGFCFGGLVSWLSAAQVTGLSAAIGYYGGGIAGHLEQSPQCATMLHFGELDAHIPLTDVDKIKQANPQLPIHVYAADHGFNCDHRGSYDATAAELARSRSLEFLAEQLGGEL